MSTFAKATTMLYLHFIHTAPALDRFREVCTVFDNNVIHFFFYDTDSKVPHVAFNTYLSKSSAAVATAGGPLPTDKGGNPVHAAGTDGPATCRPSGLFVD